MTGDESELIAVPRHAGLEPDPLWHTMQPLLFAWFEAREIAFPLSGSGIPSPELDAYRDLASAAEQALAQALYLLGLAQEAAPKKAGTHQP